MSCRRTCDRYCCVVLAHHCDWQLNFIGKHSGNAAAAAASTAATVNWRWNGAPFGGAHSASAASALAIVNIYANINNWRVNTTTMWECCASVPLCKCNELNRSRNCEQLKPTHRNYRRQPHVTTHGELPTAIPGSSPGRGRGSDRGNAIAKRKSSGHLVFTWPNTLKCQLIDGRAKPSHASLVMVNGKKLSILITKQGEEYYNIY